VSPTSVHKFPLQNEHAAATVTANGVRKQNNVCYNTFWARKKQNNVVENKPLSSSSSSSSSSFFSSSSSSSSSSSKNFPISLTL
jgi:hypothetical protein